MKSVIIVGLAILLGGPLTAQINLDKIKKSLGGTSLSSDEIVAGLKEALTNGTSKGADLVSQLDGYYKNPEIKIPFPPEVKQVEARLRQIGLGSEVDKFVESLNRGAEDAAHEAKPIFIAAIRQMTIQDAYSILKGNDDAATQYLSKTTTGVLTEKFKPVIQRSLEKVNATKYYKDLVTSYNKIPLVQKVNPNLDDYATQKAIQGLFVMIAKEEKNIRQNPLARTSDILKKVFGAN
ncbi:MAG TPA: DUF4197 domain-containing protein [Chryseolinea sp.]|nr:DUF4197 domain-containing protein [Chryseolinea sp.]